MTDFYRFPAMADIDAWSWHNQIPYVLGEAKEARDAYRAMLDSRWDTHDGEPTDESVREVGLELMDVIHAAETALRMEFTDDEVRNLRDSVIEKNRKRGYYDD